MTILARTVPSLARAVPSLARAVPSLARTVPSLVLTDGMDGMGWVDGMVGQLFFFGQYLENYLIVFHNGFRNP